MSQTDSIVARIMSIRNGMILDADAEALIRDALDARQTSPVTASARDAFEAWATSDSRAIQPLQFEERTDYNNHYYESDHDNNAFIGWKAAGLAQTPAALIPTPEQIEPILDDYLAVDCPHYEEMRRRCAQRIFDLCVVMSGAPIQSNNQIAVSDTSTDRTCK